MLYLHGVCVCVCVYARCHCASFWLFHISKLSIMSSQNWREREEMCLTPWINIAKVRAQPDVCFIIKSSSSSVTRLNDDIVLLVLCHTWAKPVDSGNNIYNRDDKPYTLQMRTLPCDAVHCEILPVTDANWAYFNQRGPLTQPNYAREFW